MRLKTIVIVNAVVAQSYLECLPDNDIPVKIRIGFGIDVAVGLVYLHSKNCMHRDIACRNCLIDVKKNIVKISDFGASKQAEFYKIPETEKIPIRWQAPEVVLTRMYTMQSDVYSYGILLWEIFNNGETPYKGIGNKEVRLKVANPNYRPRVDDSIPVLARRVMKACWRGNPKKRPKMTHVARYLIHAPKELLLPKSALSSDKLKNYYFGTSKCEVDIPIT
ncbi:Protein kinase domain-containing protein [Trichostrongylus colubriformis]|uniref:Protein kinase domain-containing protein n=1 Tax=Trichostrongylus colubriformis TaxID=6319 RepID=A0AAN8FQH4_TRICO